MSLATGSNRLRGCCCHRERKTVFSKTENISKRADRVGGWVTMCAMEQYVVRADGGRSRFRCGWAVRLELALPEWPCGQGSRTVALLLVGMSSSRAAAMAGSCDDGDDAAGSEILVGHRA